MMVEVFRDDENKTRTAGIFKENISLELNGRSYYHF